MLRLGSQPLDTPAELSPVETDGAPGRPPTVLVVDDDRAVRDVLCAVLKEEGYPVRQASGADAALQLLRGDDLPLVLCDMKMPERDGLWLLEEVLRRHPHAAVVMLTGYGDTESAVDCLKRGAADYLLKPPRITELVRAIERAWSKSKLTSARARYHQGLARRVRERTAELTAALAGVAQSYSNTLVALVNALDAREHETSDHSQRVVRYTLAIARRMGICGQELEDIGRGALLHDIGKIGVPDSILLKPGPLTHAEWVEMRRHPEVGSRILEEIEFLRPAAEIVLAHQERWDGGGYPRRLRGEAIPLGARIFAIGDTLDAMTSDRPYRKAATFAQARLEISRCGGTQFDPRCVEAFRKIPDEELEALRQENAA
ncbi:MAG: two-component system response regulator [Deltaproteobacteria bacterium 13_1_40CM_4_68_19]|nr:MAG: two-component system response regulator [Deltaproteobacteria bacterium 13_1_40CM_4_68_19]OLD45566.1 MAG: two-component system response regulator [Chloroflexi bacterium 13_1_40CM_2_68_14]